MTSEQPQKDKPDISSSLEKLFKKWPREQDNISFEEALGLLDEVELVLRDAGENPDLHRELRDIRSKLVERLDARARELGMEEEWEASKRGRGALRTYDGLLETKDGPEFFDKFRDVSPKQRDELENCGFDLEPARKLEPLAKAMRQNSAPKMFLGLLRTDPLAVIILTARYFWRSALLALLALVFLLLGNKVIAGVLIVVAVIHGLRVAMR